MNKEENIITEFVQHSTGFTFSKCDLTTGKVVINNIEITSVEDWKKVTKSLVELQQKVNQLETSIATKDSELLQLKEELRQLKTNRDEAIEYIKNNIQEGYSEVFEAEMRWDAVSGDDLLEILERGKESENI